ncbi:uncharacterized protein LOC129947169 [Eupeodes corollae]|uniref:uncharacterized protein LOC129947169 n=1 Tax=Eupeodes corollae TaxID=290404 RepID=UPI0024928107|nr:uncharacterized protein LOC129947169 [Eupeodes corollae]
MFLFKYSAVLLTACLLLLNNVNQTEGDLFGDMITGGLPILASIAGVALTGPIAPIVVGSLLTIGLAAKMMQESDKEEEPSPLSKKDFLQENAKITESLSNIKSQMAQMGAQLTDTMETHELFEDMRNALDTLCETVTDNYETIMDPNVKGIAKQSSLRAMLEYFSVFRQTLKSFVTKYIKPKGMVSAAGAVNLFFDYILRRDRVAFENGDDCYYEPVHTKLFKSYTYILKALTDAYVMVISAHTVQYQNELRDKKESEAYETKKLSVKILNQYKTDMKALMEKTKWAMDQSTRDVRNCGTFEFLKKGDTFDTLSYKNKIIGVSTKVVSVEEEGNVITGARFIVKDNILHVQIKEAPFVDEMNVDNDYHYWTEQPLTSDEVLYFDSKIKSFELGDFELPQNEYVKSIQFKVKHEDEGLIGLYINGKTAERIGKQWYPGAKSSEIKISGSESPEKFADVKNLVSKAPAPNRPYHVTFQPMNSNKDIAIPFVDVRNVYTYPGSPLQGLGLYHHTVKGSGGFLALRLRVPNMSPYVDYNVIEKVIDAVVKL